MLANLFHNTGVTANDGWLGRPCMVPKQRKTPTQLAYKWASGGGVRCLYYNCNTDKGS